MRTFQTSSKTVRGASNKPDIDSPDSRGRPASMPPSPTRWVPRRKAEILAAVRRGSISLLQACETYELTIEEFLTWQRGEALFGLAGLFTTRPYRRSNSGNCAPEEVPSVSSQMGPSHGDV